MTEPIDQLGLEWLEAPGRTADDIAEAQRMGLLDDVLAGRDAGVENTRRRYLAEAAEARAEAERLRRAPEPTPGQGGDQGPAPQGDYRELARQRLESMSPEQIAEATARGDFDQLLGRSSK